MMPECFKWLNAHSGLLRPLRSATRPFSYLQAFGRAGMPEPLDLRVGDPMGRAVEGLPAPPRDRARVLQRHRFLSYLRTHCQERRAQTPKTKRCQRGGAGRGRWAEASVQGYSPFTTSVRVRFWKSPCSWFRTRTVYLPASSSATSRITREFPSMWYREHCSAATMSSFSL